MKTIRKMMALVIAMVMVVAMALPAMAAAGEYEITVENTNEAMSINGKTYSAYKVFDLTLGDETTSGGETSYGAYAYSINSSDWAFTTLTTGATTDTTTGVITTTYGIVLTPSAADPTTYSVNGDSMTDANARSLADALQEVLPSTADGSAQGANEKATISLSEGGWYAVYGVVIPTDPKQNPAEEVVAAVGLTTTDKKVTVNPKASVPTLEKTITAVTEPGEEEEVDGAVKASGQVAVAKVGSTVSYQLDSVVPDLTGYDDYKFIITDTISSGLTYSNTSLSSLVVKINNAVVAAAKYSLAIDGQTFTLTIPFDTLNDYTAGAAIVVTYDAVVNDGALTTDYENNTASLEYSHSPYDDNTNHTPDKKTYVIDLNIDVDKVAENASGKKLDGAEFKLYKLDGANKLYYHKATNTIEWKTAQADGDTFTTDSNGKLTTQVQGLDQGTYYLEETVAPVGYNILADPIEVTISATADGSDTVDSTTATYTATTDGANVAVANGTVDLTTAQTSAQPVANVTIINNAGSILPSTGGMGTTIFYIVGVVLVIGAGILLVTRRRMSAN